MSNPQLGGAITGETKQLIRQFVQIQAQIDTLNKQITQLRESKKQIETGLIGQIKASGLSSYGITYQGRKIYIGNDNTYDTLTFKFLEECLTKLYNGNKGQVKQIIDFIKQQRLARKESNTVIKIGSSNKNTGNNSGKK
jgi:hypothetical protein